LPFVIEGCHEFKLVVICRQRSQTLQHGCIQRDAYLFYISGHNLLKHEGVGLLLNERFLDQIKIAKNVSSWIM